MSAIQRKSLGTGGTGIPKEIWLKHFPETSDDRQDFAFAPKAVVTLKGCPGRCYRVIEGYYAQVYSGMNKTFENWYRLQTANRTIAYWKEYQLELV